MATHIALLRAVNLPGHNKVGMADLRRFLIELGMEEVRSLLQSGNLVFRSATRSTTQVEQLLAGAAKQSLGLETDFFIRSAGDWKALVAGNPFLEEAKRDPGHLVVMFLREAPGRDDVTALRAAITGREVVHVDGRHAYIIYPDGVGRSRLTTALLERKLGTRGTGRNWNTVVKLGALAGVS